MNATAEEILKRNSCPAKGFPLSEKILYLVELGLTEDQATTLLKADQAPELRLEGVNLDWYEGYLS